MRFLIEAERLRAVVRRSPAIGGARRENSAEHSWHLCLFASVLTQWTDEPVDTDRVVRMLMLHDLVEVDAGDVSIFDEAMRHAQEEHEQRAAERIFGLLPEPQASEFLGLWVEFERGQTAEARFARALDRLQPIILNHLVQGGTWAEQDIDVTLERRLTAPVADSSSQLRSLAEAVFEEAVAGGWLGATSPDNDPA